MKKILETLKRKWAEYLLEIFVIMIGILGAYSLNSWNEERKERVTELTSLRNLKSEFIFNHIKFIEQIKGHEKVLKSNQDYVSRLYSGKVTKFSEVWHGPRIKWFTYDPANGVLNTLISSGDIVSITNDSLKNLLMSWQGLVTDYREESEWDHEFVRNQWLPYVRKHFPKISNTFPSDTIFLDEETKSLYLDKIDDPEYQNLVGENLFYKSIYLNQQHELETNLNKIITIIDEELERWQ